MPTDTGAELLLDDADREVLAATIAETGFGDVSWLTLCHLLHGANSRSSPANPEKSGENDMRPVPNERPFVYVTVQGATLDAMRAQATTDISRLLGTERITVGCDRVEPVERVGSASDYASEVVLWEATFRGGFDYTERTVPDAR